ncbi:hypothetical protein [Texcoconibacillus texcoconensis]|uniref:Cell division protein FtsB n=1 Tax=Texcoconibacillus texcoconensis TaxID=1095777 RepID=A0A840QU40_9BACI|nr:hypothetical protein [Texcoconibacillus texcoconensis]MBB5174801.1 cell division protein FtsB [Texcoconibacillus texcoconensis]
MAYIASILIIALCLYFILVPFFLTNKKLDTVSIEDDTDQLTIEEVYATLNELEMEYNMKKLTDHEYKTLKKKYQRLAAKMMKEEGPFSQGPSANDEIEQEIEELKKIREGK